MSGSRVTGLHIFIKRVKEFSEFFDLNYSHEELLRMWRNFPFHIKEMYIKEAKQERNAFYQNKFDMAAKERSAPIETPPVALRQINVDSNTNANCQPSSSRKNKPVTTSSCIQGVNRAPSLLLEMLNSPNSYLEQSQPSTSHTQYVPASQDENVCYEEIPYEQIQIDDYEESQVIVIDEEIEYVQENLYHHVQGC
ncbi:unnamed protein product [Caenorhabditis brenneri]